MDRRTYLAAVGTCLALAGCSETSERSTTDDDTETTDLSGETTTGPTEVQVETVVEGLTVPWGAAYRDGTLYLTERPGRVVRVVDGRREEVADRSGQVAARGEAGLMGLVFHPDDPDTAYTYQTYEDGGLKNRIVRHDVADGWAAEPIVEGIPGAFIHDGGRLAVGPDGALFATCGDAGEAGKAQDKDTLNGTVLRLTLDGEPHPDNPFNNAVFTYGHRNPQGVAFRNGRLYITEHGPDTHDEINVLEAGNNYGWPVVKGESDRAGFTDPITSYTPTIAPASAAFYDGPVERWQGDFFFGTLAGIHLHRVRISEDDRVAEQERLFAGEYGRLRTVFTGPDDHLYVTTSNRDGRGNPDPRDDRVLRFRPT